ncbi:MAG: ATP synthase subunit I [Thiohalospira sp.]|uniref:ATP synthase subunit I n=1 Tax=Thiohalospira sp. TaxID=3080549 RepID=UPI0039806B36
MKFATTVLQRSLLRLLGVQAALTAVAALAWFSQAGPEPALAALYGGGITLAATLLSGWRLLRATEALGSSTTRGLAELYIGFAIRFVLALALLALGMGVLELDPLGILTGFAVAQLGYLFNRVETAPPQAD